MGVEVIVVQHAEKIRTSGDPGLTDEGHRQAACVAMWLAEHHPDVSAVIASPLRRATETGRAIAEAFGVGLTTDDRFRERMNWDDDAGLSLDEFMAEWRRATHDRSYQPAVGNSSIDAAERFIAAIAELERCGARVVVVVAHGGVTVDTLRTLAGDDSVAAANPDLIADGVPCCAITRLRLCNGTIEVVAFPSTAHLPHTSRHRPV